MTGEKKVIILLGAPGAGKGTQAKKLMDQLKIPQVSTGDLFRKAISEKTKLGVEAQRFMDKGQLVPDEVTFEMLKERIAQKDCTKGFILDGFPRTPPQAQGLTKLLESIGARVLVIGVEVPSQLLIQRLSGRRTCEKCGSTFHVDNSPPKAEGVCDKCKGKLVIRPDDQQDVIQKRLTVYEQNTAPVVEYYKARGDYKGIDGNKSEDTVFKSLITVVKS